MIPDPDQQRRRQHALQAAALLAMLAVTSGVDAARRASGNLPWAFCPVDEIELPEVPAPWNDNPIDALLYDAWQREGLQPNELASRRTLLRRVFFDLIGLPPTPAQLRAFLDDERPGAFARVVDELLASEHYGERWGRHWLDLARYADTSGDAADAPIPEAHLYRDYVIRAFNDDLPYDQFILEQIAGDLLEKHAPSDRARQRAVATGYIALARRFGNGEYSDMHLVIDNTMATIGQSMLGLTVQCARCHDHKFDPISMEDYYGLYGYFSSTQYPHASTEHGRQRKNFVDLVGGGEAYAVCDKRQSGEIGDARIHRRGEPGKKGDNAPRGFIDCLDDSDAGIPADESGRLELARWIASPDNPLTARVMVNRIWQYHFGKGIVQTSSNFGAQGSAPTYPALLDYLAQRFVQSGWSIKAMHRLMVTSRTYQLSSGYSPENFPADASNDYCWRFTRRRLDAEPMRDAVLFVSGRLQLGNPGPHPFPQPNEKNEYPYTQHRPFTEDYDHEYRSVYLPSRRLARHPYMELFNGAGGNECTARREVSTVPLQSLFWMNSDFIATCAQSFAQRLLNTREQTEHRLDLAYELAYARLPTSEEIDAASKYLNAYELPEEADDRDLAAWTSLCKIILASNEFIYID